MNKELAQALREDGARRFARWNARHFDAVIDGPAKVLGDRTADEDGSAELVVAYLRLVQEAIGEGLLTQIDAEPSGWSSFLERLLVEVVPNRLFEVQASRRIQVLADVWNLGEGLLREPAWVDRYVNACSQLLPRLDQLQLFLIRVLKPVLVPTTTSTWSGSANVSQLDMRKVHNEFLPGAIHVVAPRILQVEDRHRKDLTVAVLLQQGQKSELLGQLTGLPDYQQNGESPRIEFGDGRVRIGKAAVELPTLRRCHAHAVAHSGFVAVSAVDSQRLWIIECA